MMMSNFLLLWMVPLLFAGSLSAQSIWVAKKEKSLSLEILRPTPARDIPIAQSTVVFISGHFSWSDNVKLIGELPFAHGKVKAAAFKPFVIPDETETIVGNPYIAIEKWFQNTGLSMEFGLRLPLATGGMTGSGAISNLDDASFVQADFDRAEAFVPNLLTVTARMNYQPLILSNVAYRIRFGPTAWMDRTCSGECSESLGWLDYESDSTGDNKELWLDYSGVVAGEGKRAGFLAGVSGRFLATQLGTNVGDRLYHSLFFALHANLGQFQPGLQLRIPLQNERFDLVRMDRTLGVLLGYHFDCN